MLINELIHTSLGIDLSLSKVLPMPRGELSELIHIRDGREIERIDQRAPTPNEAVIHLHTTLSARTFDDGRAGA